MKNFFIYKIRFFSFQNFSRHSYKINNFSRSFDYVLRTHQPSTCVCWRLFVAFYRFCLRRKGKIAQLVIYGLRGGGGGGLDCLIDPILDFFLTYVHFLCESNSSSFKVIKQLIDFYLRNMILGCSFPGGIKLQTFLFLFSFHISLILSKKWQI